MAAVPLVDIDPLDFEAGEVLGLLDDVAQGVAFVRIAGQRALACSTN